MRYGDDMECTSTQDGPMSEAKAAPMTHEGSAGCAPKDRHCVHNVGEVAVLHGLYVPKAQNKPLYRCCHCGWWSVGSNGWTQSKPEGVLP